MFDTIAHNRIHLILSAVSGSFGGHRAESVAFHYHQVPQLEQLERALLVAVLRWQGRPREAPVPSQSCFHVTPVPLSLQSLVLPRRSSHQVPLKKRVKWSHLLSPSPPTRPMPFKPRSKGKESNWALNDPEGNPTCDGAALLQRKAGKIGFQPGEVLGWPNCTFQNLKGAYKKDGKGLSIKGFRDRTRGRLETEREWV